MFDFTALSDITFLDSEKQVIENIFNKCLGNFNEQVWPQGRQSFIESFFRCLTVAIPANAVPSVVAAQAICESGWFKTGSIFGVKATQSQEQNDQGQSAVTHEVVNGQVITTTGDFYKGTVQQQFGNYFVYVQNRKPGTAQFLPRDAAGYVSYLQNPAILASNGHQSGAYSTAGVNYSNTILEVIKDNNLSVFDHL